ncbi:CHAT domain-containing protein [Mycena latifolia]|nr:CHAT domain-containing protein [Mycena latifolia]
MLKEGREHTSNEPANKPMRLTKLAVSLLRNYERLGNLDDINKAISMLQEAATLTPDAHPTKISRLGNLGSSLSLRFEQLGDVTDLNKSVLMLENALRLMPNDHADRSLLLKNLAHSLSLRFKRLGDLEDLHKAVLMLEDSVAFTPDSYPDKLLSLTNLGHDLSVRFERLGDLEDLEKAVLIFRQVIALTPAGHPSEPSSFADLGHALSLRFEKLGDLTDINESVVVLQNALTLTPYAHPAKVPILIDLGSSLSIRFQQLHDPNDFEQMLIHYTAAACSTTGPPTLRFVAAKQWAHHAQNTQHHSLMHAYTVVLGVLPELAWFTASDQQHDFEIVGGVVRDAAAAAITVHKYDTAVEWLEQGRSVIWGQLLNLRTSVDDLKQIHPALAETLMSLSEEHHSPLQMHPFTPQRYHDNTHARENLLQQIRLLPGFERFLLPKTMSELSHAARGGPVVILNASEVSCDALILLPGLPEVLHIPLPDLTLQDTQNLQTSLELISQQEGDLTLNLESEFARILSDLWMRVGRPVLDGLGLSTPSDRPTRIWWCPTGPLASLPIHAAGLYGETDNFGSKLSDYVISSYTPSLTTLIQGFHPKSMSQERLKLLAVGQASRTGPSMPGAKAELDGIERIVSASGISVLRLEENSAIMASVERGMMDSIWMHLACPGVQDMAHPTESAFLLAENSRLTLSRILGLPIHADLAFLSSCSTTKTSKNSKQDESVTLAAGMIFAGCRGVVGTMGSVMDTDVPEVVADVYAHMCKESPPDSTRAAEALHIAVRNLRERSGQRIPFIRWVPFIHVGV